MKEGRGFCFITLTLQIFGVVLFSVFSVVNGFTEIKKTPKCEKHIERSRQHPGGHRNLNCTERSVIFLAHRKFVKLQWICMSINFFLSLRESEFRGVLASCWT